MKKLIFGAFCAVAFVCAQAQTSNPAATHNEMTGTIKEYTPGNALVLETLPPNAPTSFKLSKNVTYVDKDGKTVEAAGLTANQKVSVHYTKVGADYLADKVTLIGN